MKSIRARHEEACRYLRGRLPVTFNADTMTEIFCPNCEQATKECNDICFGGPGCYYEDEAGIISETVEEINGSIIDRFGLR